jgi:hypothetical protein
MQAACILSSHWFVLLTDRYETSDVIREGIAGNTDAKLKTITAIPHQFIGMPSFSCGIGCSNFQNPLLIRSPTPF